MNKLQLQTRIPDELAGKRLDQVIALLIPEHSRSRIQTWIKSGNITVNNKTLRQRDVVNSGDIIRVNVEFAKIELNKPENIPLDIVFQDNELIVINKPAGLVVHPGAGNPDRTLVNALLNFDQKLNLLPRAGIIHRLDKDTTGIMVIARTPTTHTFLIDKLQQRDIKREYQTIVCGQVTAGGAIENKIGRHPIHRTRMAVTANGKPATTHFRIIKKFKHYTHLRVNLETGRTHQIRVHMSHINHPVLGDPVYGKNNSALKGIDPVLRDLISNFKRQALHAYRLEFPHPVTNELKTFQAEPPEDFKQLINALETYDC